MVLSDNIVELRSFVQVLLDKISALELTNYRLEAENAQLKALLHLDSHNSSKPPSSDGLHKKPAFPKEKAGKPGSQQGHTLGMVENPDHIVTCKPDKYNCGQELSREQVCILARCQVFDLPEPRLFEIIKLIAQCQVATE